MKVNMDKAQCRKQLDRFTANCLLEMVPPPPPTISKTRTVCGET